MTTLLLALTVFAAAPEKPKLVVLDLQVGAGIDATLVGPLTDAVTHEAERSGFFDVVSSRDLQTLLGVERQRQLMGCGEEASRACMAELTGALGARFVMNGTVARLGDAYQLTLNTLDSQKAQPLGRSTRVARSFEALRAALPWAVAEATATPLPAPPSRVLPYTLIGVGGAAAIFGLAWGAVVLTQEQQLQTTLQTAGATTQLLNTRESYFTQAQNLERLRWGAIGAATAGLAALIVGLVLLPADGATTQVALVPTGAGLGLAGRFP